MFNPRFMQRKTARKMCRPSVGRLENRTLLSGYVITDLPLTTAVGGSSQTGLVEDGSGNLFGSTTSGGAHNSGSVFEIARGTGQIVTVADNFTSSNNGASDPTGRLAIDSTGTIYGTTFLGGVSSGGTVWKLLAGSHAIQVVASFDAAHGTNPIWGVILDKSGNLFGTTESGGTITNVAGGTLWKIPANGSSINVLNSFSLADGFNAGALVIDAAGNLFGATSAKSTGTTNNIFELPANSPAGTPLTLLTAITPAEGLPGGTLSIDPLSGALVGTTSQGTGANINGTIFKFTPGASSISIISTFDGISGLNPFNGAIIDSAGNFFGTTDKGGGHGSIFELPSGATTLTNLVDFNGVNGQSPINGLVLDSGNIFGVTGTGSPAGMGTVFEASATGGDISAQTIHIIPNPPPANTSVFTPLIAHSTLPATVVLGTKVHGTVSVTLTNQTAALVKGKTTVTLYLSLDGKVDSSAVSIASHVYPLKVKAGRTVKANIAVRSLPVALAAGSYSLVAQVTDSSAGVSSTPIGPALIAAAPFVAPTAAVVSVVPATVKAGKFAGVTLLVSNGGNIPTTGAIDITVFLAPVGSAPFTTAPQAFVSHAKIRAINRTKLRLRYKVAIGTAAGLYTISVNVVVNGIAATAITAAPITII